MNNTCVGIRIRRYDCCIHSHMCFVGRFAQMRRCAECGEKRFEDDRDSDDEVSMQTRHLSCTHENSIPKNTRRTAMRTM